MPTAPTPPSGPPRILTLRLLLNGQPAPASGLNLASITVNQSLHTPATATLLLFADDSATGKASFGEVETLAPGTHVSVAAGYGRPLHVLFQGTVKGVAIARQHDQQPTVTVSCGGDTPPAAARQPADAQKTPVLTIENGVNLQSFSLHLDARAAVMGTVTVTGSHRAQPGTTVLLRGLGTQFDRMVPVQRVRHTFAGGDWQTRLSLGSVHAPVVEPHPLALPAVGAGLGILGAVAYAWMRKRYTRST